MEEDRNGEHVIRVDGWLEGEEEAAELLRIARSALCPVVVDLKYLQTSDSFGIRTLHTLHWEGAQLSRASDFIKLMLGMNDEAPTPVVRSISGESS